LKGAATVAAGTAALSNGSVTDAVAGQGNGGFEEWTAATGVAPVPELGTFFPIIGLLVAVFSTQAQLSSIWTLSLLSW
jgi:hypothetical protein